MLLAREPGSSSQRLIDSELRAIGTQPAGMWELGSSEAIKRAAREGLGLAFLSRYAVAEEVERGDLESFRIAGRPPLLRHFSIAHLAPDGHSRPPNGASLPHSPVAARNRRTSPLRVGIPHVSVRPIF